MKSGIFCFNPAVFRKNALRCTPLWMVYLLVLIVVVPVSLWSNLHSYVSYYAADAGAQEYRSMSLYFFYNVMNTLDGMVYVVAGMAVLAIMAVYGYLFSARRCNMMHAFPVTREELFFTNLATALGVLLIPEFFAFLVTVLVCLGNGITCVQYAALYFLILATESVLFLAMSLFAAMLTGVVFAVPVIAAVFNYFYIFFRTTLGNIICATAYGITDYSVSGDGQLLAMAPISYFGRRVRFRAAYITSGTEEYLESLEVVGTPALAWYLLAALVLLVLAFLLYRRRPLEKAGDLAAFSVVSPILRWLVGFIAGYAASTGICTLLEGADVHLSKLSMACLTLVFGILVFFIAEMLMQKKIRIFGRKLAGECLAFAACLLAGFGMVLFVSRLVEQYIPDEAEVASVEFQLSYAFEVSGDDCGEILAIQRELIAHGQEWLSETRGSSDYANIRIVYTLKDARTVERYYMVPLEEEGIAVIARASALERRADLFVQANVGADSDAAVTGTFDLNYEDDEAFDGETAVVLIDAIRRDAEAGTIQKYNSISENGTWSEAEATKYCGYVSFTIPTEHQSVYYDDYDGDDLPVQGSTVSSVSFGTDCTNLLQALVDTGLIASEEELLLYSEY